MKYVPLLQFFCCWSLTQSPKEKHDKCIMFYLVIHQQAMKNTTAWFQCTDKPLRNPSFTNGGRSLLPCFALSSTPTAVHPQAEVRKVIRPLRTSQTALQKAQADSTAWTSSSPSLIHHLMHLHSACIYPRLYMPSIFYSSNVSVVPEIFPSQSIQSLERGACQGILLNSRRNFQLL